MEESKSNECSKYGGTLNATAAGKGHIWFNLFLPLDSSLITCILLDTQKPAAAEFLAVKIRVFLTGVCVFSVLVWS